MTTQTISAVLPEAPTNNAKDLARKVLSNQWTLITNTPQGLKTPVRVKVWRSRSAASQMVYASVWFASPNGDGAQFSGHGRALAGNYHQLSAAVEAAIRNSKVKLVGDDGKPVSIHATSDEVTFQALNAVATALGCDLTACSWIS